jgi:hypothetical protein
MSKIRKLSVCVVALSSWVLFSAGIANAIQIGPVIKMDSHGHLTVEEHSLPAPIQPQNIRGLPIKIDLPALGRAIAHPFEQFANSVKDPFGYKKKAQEMENQALESVNATEQWVDGWMATLGKIGALVLGVVMAFAAFLFRQRRRNA